MNDKMMKTASSVVNESFEKIAARAWKKRLSELTDESVDKLLKSKVFDRNKELKGLNLGTNKILQKANAKNIGNPKKAGAHYIQSLKERGALSPFTPKYEQTKHLINNSTLFGQPNAGHSKWNKSGLTMVPRKRAYREVEKGFSDLRKDNLDPSLPSKLKRKDREGKKWANAIMARHEADEVRHGAKALKNKKLSIELSNGDRKELTGIAGHMSPKVLMSEGTNLALAPKSTKDYFKGLRSLDNNGTNEIEALKSITGFDYSNAPATYNKSLARKGERDLANYKKERLGLR